MRDNTTVKLAVIIPVFNEDRLFPPFLRRLLTFLTSGFGVKPTECAIVLIDDGSRVPLSISSMSLAPQGVRLCLLRHPVNLGQGAALQTGITYARENLKADSFILMDADGQHDPADIPALLAPVWAGKADIVFGNRFHGPASIAGIPLQRRIVLRVALMIERIICGLKLSDAHNGFRAFNSRCAQSLNLKQNRMAHATEFKQLVARGGLRYAEVPVTIHYSKDTMEKGQSNIGGVAILKDLLKVFLFDEP